MKRRSVSSPIAVCVGPRRSLCRGPALLRSFCQVPALSVSGPGALCVRALHSSDVLCRGPAFSQSEPGALSFCVCVSGIARPGSLSLVSAPGTLSLSVSGPARCVRPRRSVSGPALCVGGRWLYEALIVGPASLCAGPHPPWAPSSDPRCHSNPCATPFFCHGPPAPIRVPPSRSVRPRSAWRVKHQKKIK